MVGSCGLKAAGFDHHMTKPYYIDQLRGIPRRARGSLASSVRPIAVAELMLYTSTHRLPTCMAVGAVAVPHEFFRMRVAHAITCLTDALCQAHAYAKQALLWRPEY